MRTFARILSIVVFFASMALASAGDKPELQGYCPVAYTEMHKAIKGEAKYASKYKGHTYYLANAEAKMMFEKDPGAYVNQIAYGGQCATAVAMGSTMNADPKVFAVEKNKVYLFSSVDAKKAFEKDPAMTIQKADFAYTKQLEKN